MTVLFAKPLANDFAVHQWVKSYIVHFTLTGCYMPIVSQQSWETNKQTKVPLNVAIPHEVTCAAIALQSQEGSEARAPALFPKVTCQR